MISLNKQSVWKGYWRLFLGVFFAVGFFTLIALYSLNLIPQELQFGPWFAASQEASSSHIANGQTEAPIAPTHIHIPKIGVDTPVSNPESDNVDVLDEWLTKGSVHYPGSGEINYGNMFLFAHSTGFKVVQNKAYKAFNDLKSLANGDEIYVTGDNGKLYLYTVTSVKMATDKDVLVRFDGVGHMLTLSTCNTFGKKEDRYVVEAEFKGETTEALTQ